MKSTHRVGAIIRQMLRQKATYSHIVKTTRCSKSTISYHARILNIPPYCSCARYDWHKVQDCINKGWTFTQCRARFGFSAGAWHAAVESTRIVYKKPPLMPIEQHKKRGSVRRRLLQEMDPKCRRCTKCHRKTWMKKPIPLELHHKNGNKDDHRRRNLKWLCPNCHSQSDTWTGRNVKRCPVAHTG
jgi:hypothetical protein